MHETHDDAAMPKTADAVFSYIESFTNLERGLFRPRDYRLERMERLLVDFDSPHLGRKTVHLAGSKGKGSTACYIAAGIAARTGPVGLYCSPHVSDYRERITLNGRAPADQLIIRAGRKIHRYVCDQRKQGVSESHLPTTFELLTLLAFLVFREAGVLVQVLETGLGGRLDATNVCQPDITLITPIEREHTDYLGNKLTGIAREKAGILKPGVPVCIAPQRPVVRTTIRTIAAQRNCPVLWDGRKFAIRNVRIDRTGTRFLLRTALGERITGLLRMLGEPQAENAALSLVALQYLFPEESPQDLLDSSANAGLPGRMELIHVQNGSARLMLLDGAHTPNSIDRLCTAASAVLGHRYTVIFGSVRGKDHTTMAERIARDAARVIVSRPGTFKASDPESVYAVFQSLGVPCALELDARAALEHAIASSEPVLVCGSFYMVSEIRRLCIETGIIRDTIDLFGHDLPSRGAAPAQEYHES